ncbi:MAG: hypothetical protein KDD31_06285 [Muricauda sp.]|nr:hypothetical protein [Allomuricauda sp.]
MRSLPTQPRHSVLAIALGSALMVLLSPVGLRAATITANGELAGQCSIGDAIRAANSNSTVGNCSYLGSPSSSDRVLLTYDPVLSQELVITSNLELSSSSATQTISGNGVTRILRIGDNASSPTVLISSLHLQSGNATGADGGNGAGAGAGLGGALFIYSGDVTIDGVEFTSNQARGGDGLPISASVNNGGGGGGGMGGGGGASGGW